MLCHNCNREIEYNAVCPYCGTRALKEPLPHHLPVGTVIDNRYKVMGVLGEGGFGVTYLGYNQRLGLPVAIKEFFPRGVAYRESTGGKKVYSSTDDGAAFFSHGKERFLSEAKTLVRFNAEPGIVSVMDFVDENNTAYLIMEYLDGETLQQYLKKHGTLSADEAFSMLEPMMRTLEKVHKAGIIHRDISPDNIMMLGDGSLKLMDFGAARDYSDENRSMSVMLKKGYAPAEQYRRKGEQGPWTDVYALCATIYRCITGVTPTDSLDRMSGEELKKPSELGVAIAPAKENLLMYGMAIHKKDRCQSMGELLSKLEQTKNGAAVPKTIPQENKASAFPVTGSIQDPNATMLIGKNDDDPNKTLYANNTVVEPPAAFAETEKSPAQQTSKKKRWKKAVLTIVSILIACIAALIVLRNNGDTYHGFHFRMINDDSVDNNTAVICGYFGLLPKELVIPSEVYGHTVTRIAICAFNRESRLEKVIIPDTVKMINREAFKDCDNLTSITIPDSVTSISDDAFFGCDNLTIYGKKGSEAEQYAKENNIPFKEK